MSDVLTGLFRRLQAMERVLLAGAIMVIAGLTILNVFCRSLFSVSLAFAEEATQICMIVVCFVGISYAASRGRHIRMTALYDQCSLHWRRRLMLGIAGSTALLLFLFAWYACRYVLTVYRLGGAYPALGIPYYVVYAVVPLGLFSAGVQYLLAVVRNWNGQQVFLSYEVKDEYAVVQDI